jgi:magnesium transporter
MIMKRNVIVLKHSFKPQTTVIRLLEMNVKTIFHDEIEVYFEDLEDKIDYIVNDLTVLEENISSVEESYKSIVEMKTNFIIKVLTLFSSFFLPLTLIASFY